MGVFLSGSVQSMGLKVVRHYPSSLLQEAMVWDIAEKEGWIYLATDDGLIQFDGSEGELFPLNNHRPVRSVSLDENLSRIYVGGINEFGYFHSSPHSSLSYVSLSDSIPKVKNIGNIWGIYPWGDYLILQGDNAILTYNLVSGNHYLSSTPVKIDGSKCIDGVLWLATDDGLKFLLGKNIEDAPGADLLKGERIREIIPYRNGLLVVGANSMWQYKDRILTPLTRYNEYIKELGEIFSADFNGRYLALGSVDKGIGIIDLDNDDFNIYNEENGMESNTMLSLKFDRKGDLIAGMQYGLSKLLLTLPVETIANESMSIGSGYVLYQKDNKLYLGTNRGLFTLDTDFHKLKLKKTGLKAIEGLRGQVWAIRNLFGKLLVAHDRGLYEILDNGTIKKIGNSQGVWDVQRMIGNPTKAYEGTYSGLNLLEQSYDGQIKEIPIEGYNISAYNFVQESPTVIWSNYGEDGLHRILIDTLHNKVADIIEYKETDDGVPLNANINLSRIDNDVLISTPAGLYKYDNASDKIIREIEISRLLGYPRLVKRVKKTGGSLYALTDKEILQADPAGILDMKRIPVSPGAARPMHERDLFFPVDNDFLAYPVKEGFLLYDFSFNPDSTSLYDLTARINRVMITNSKDSVIFRGNLENVKIEPILKHSENSIRFEFGNEESLRRGTLFSTRLGKEEWSTPSPLLQKEYTNLKEGKYNFEVKAIAPDGKETSDTFVFRISPPWWRSPWMKVIYIFMALSLAFFIVRLEQLRVHRNQNKLIRSKDEEIQRQQEEYQRVSEEKDRHIMELEREKMEKELKHKAQEMANVMMTLSHKNVTLQMVKKGLHEIMENLPKGSTDARKSIMNLQSKVVVDMHSDDILKRIENEFDIVHDNYMKKLRAKYPELNHNEVLLCAYIRMNLPTKEIAPLLNISPRGVETLRYRLKKKLNLEKEISLTDFLLSDVL